MSYDIENAVRQFVQFSKEADKIVDATAVAKKLHDQFPDYDMARLTSMAIEEAGRIHANASWD